MKNIRMIPAVRNIEGKEFKISIPLCKNKKDIKERKEWLSQKGFKYFRTFKEKDGTALYAAK